MRTITEMRPIHSNITVAIPSLTKLEQEELDRCEGVLCRGLATFFEVGTALLTIRENRLYRITHTTFESYCRDRWNIGRSYACRVIGAAERIKLLPNDDAIPKPANEFQIRPFLRLNSEQFPKAWRQVVKKAKGGKLTSGVIQEILQEFSEANGNSVKHPGSSNRINVRKNTRLGQILALLHETKCAVEKGQTDNALNALNRIEDLLFEAV
jgi:hypothetical protein